MNKMRGIINIKKRGQEEMVGFVLIVVIVAIVLVVFLGIMLRGGKNKETKKEAIDVHQFLSSLMEYTSECALTYDADYFSMDELIAECYAHPESRCLSGNTTCQSLNRTLNGILNAAWNVGGGSVYNGYVFNSTYEENLTSFIKISQAILLTKGNCSSGVYRGSEIPLSYSPGKIITSFRVCYSQ